MMRKIKSKANQATSANSVLSKGIFWEARTRIFAWYLLLISLLVGLSIPIFTRLVFLQIDQRVKEDLKEEKRIFQRFARAANSRRIP